MEEKRAVAVAVTTDFDGDKTTKEIWSSWYWQFVEYANDDFFVRSYNSFEICRIINLLFIDRVEVYLKVCIIASMLCFHVVNCCNFFLSSKNM